MRCSRRRRRGWRCKADNMSGFLWVTKPPNTSKARPYRVTYRLRPGGKILTGGYFASAEAAALSVARMPEAQAEAQRRAEGA